MTKLLVSLRVFCSVPLFLALTLATTMADSNMAGAKKSVDKRQASILVHAVAPGEHPFDDDSPYRLSNALEYTLLKTNVAHQMSISKFLGTLSHRMKQGARGPHITIDNVDLNDSLCPEGGVLHALVIGINDYPAGLKLQYPVGEAKRIAKAFSDFCKNTDTTILLDQEANREGIKSSLHDLSKVVKPEDHVVIHFSGHSVYQYEDFIAPSDGAIVEPERVKFEYLSLRSLLDDVSKAAFSLMLIDGSRGRVLF